MRFSPSALHEESPAASRLRLDRQLCFALYAASNLIVRAYGPCLQSLGLTYPQYLAMLALWTQSPRTVGSLCEELMLNFGTLSPLLKRLESVGLIARHRDPKDERRVVVELTPAGSALKREALDMQDKLQCLIDLPLEELGQLRERTQILTDSLLRHLAQRSPSSQPEPTP